MSKEISNRAKTEWKLLITEYEERSVSCAEFCKLHQVSKGQIYKWRQYFLSQEKLMVERSAFIPLTINNDQESDMLCARYFSPPLRQMRRPLHTNFFAAICHPPF